MRADDLLVLTSDIVSAHVGNNDVAAADLPELIRATYTALAAAGGPVAAQEEPAPSPAVSVRKSLASPEHIVSMIDGKPYKMLRRHLRTHGLTPETYRRRFDLPYDYPMTAPAYSEHRRGLARTLGLGRKKAEAPAVTDEAAPVTASRPRKLKLFGGDMVKGTDNEQ